MRTLRLSVPAVAVLIAVAPAEAGGDANRATARRTAKRLFASVQLPGGASTANRLSSLVDQFTLARG